MLVRDLPKKIDFYRLMKKRGEAKLTVHLDVVPDETISSLFHSPCGDGNLDDDVNEDTLYVSSGNTYVLWFKPGAHSSEEAINRLVDAATCRTEDLIKGLEEEVALQRSYIEKLQALKA